MNLSKGLSGDLKPEQKKNTANRTTVVATTDIRTER